MPYQRNGCGSEWFCARCFPVRQRCLVPQPPSPYALIAKGRQTKTLAAAYAEQAATLLIPTRLDLSPRLGGILAAAAAGRLALTEAGIGPGAGDGLEPLTAAGLACRLMQTRSAHA